MIFEFIFGIWVKIMWFLSFSGKNDAESLLNFVKNLILNLKHAKLDQKSEIRHVRSCQDLSRRTSTYFKPSEILLFFQILHLSIFYEQIYHFFIKSCVFISKFIIFYWVLDSDSGWFWQLRFWLSGNPNDSGYLAFFRFCKASILVFDTILAQQLSQFDSGKTKKSKLS